MFIILSPPRAGRYFLEISRKDVVYSQIAINNTFFLKAA
jgi:hypothetical protein